AARASAIAPPSSGRVGVRMVHSGRSGDGPSLPWQSFGRRQAGARKLNAHPPAHAPPRRRRGEAAAMATRTHAAAADAGGGGGGVDPEAAAADAGLLYVSDADPGIAR